MNLISKLTEKLMMTEEELLRFALTMPRRYKQYFIPKRNSNERRLIAQPSQEAKFIQRIIIAELRELLTVHKAATAYEKGTGIRLNAIHHVGNRYLLKMDFKNFFPSITPELLFMILRDCGIKYDDRDRTILEHALFFKSTRRSRLRLSVGAPSSPFISNFIMNIFDENLAAYCLQQGITYTRYADDLTFTCNKKGILFNVPDVVKQFSKEHCHGKIRINSSKTVFSSKAFNRHVTGIVLTNDNQLSIGRARKREIASLVNSFKYGHLDLDESSRLKGLLAYANHIEPDFIARMKTKYSADVIDAIFHLDSTQKDH
ncbi:retron St85 family RNA-directed DNA polymerase [Alcaligenes ammonioxydans]|uniref:retron St85 family RNA-directed DNA polymerase n=1 Tax=Alcaligenes ammonioxydans TaxID=2582914 RepID=UPI001F064C98|nr:retron St85 family RNA-directed DNA polymerase [Alcaligenes ammonioxydans]MCH1879076.1 retron St85 family RNA-directed DNA polymerase [Alcaligenes ammonioxydans]